MEYLTLSEISFISKLSIARIKELLDTAKYSKYKITENNTVKVSVDFLTALEQQDTEPEEQQEQEEQTIESDNSQTEIERLRQEVQELKAAISQKDKVIADFANRFAELASQAQVIAGQAQVLQLAEKRDIKTLDTMQTEQSTARPQEQTQPPAARKQGFFKRLFRRS